MTFGENLQFLLEERDITQKDFASMNQKGSHAGNPEKRGWNQRFKEKENECRGERPPGAGAWSQASRTEKESDRVRWC